MNNSKIGKIVGKVVAITLVLSMVSLVGCQNNTTSASTTSSTTKLAADATGTITITGWNKQPAYYQMVADKFKKLYPNVTITPVLIDSTYVKLYSQLAAGSGVPDVNQTQRRDFKSFLSKFPDAWADVSPWVKPIEKDLPKAVQEDSKDAKGRYMSFPWDIGPCGTYYRTDMFKTAGIDPASLNTWDDFITAGQKVLTAFPGTYMIGMDEGGASDITLVEMLFNQLGGEWYDAAGKANLANDKMIQVFNLLVKMKNAGIMINLPNFSTDVYNALNDGKLATLTGATWYAPHFAASVQKQALKFNITKMPAFTAGGNRTAQAGGSILAVSSKTSNLNLAGAFVSYLSLNSAGGVAVGWSFQGLFPAYTPAYKDDALVFESVDPYFGTSLGSFFMTVTDYPVTNNGTHYIDLTNALKTAIGNIMIKGQDPKTALTAASAAAQKAIDIQ